MPLLIITGFPSSGKSVICKRIKQDLEERGVSDVVLVEDDLYGKDLKEIYSDFKKEKEHRNFLRSTIQRHLTKERVVICDSLNYIKGFRYELFCIAKNVSTTYAVVYCNVNSSLCCYLNNQKETLKYPEKVLNQLIVRYEKPDAKNRWDTPLFSVHVGNAKMLVSGDRHEDLFSSDLDFDDFTSSNQEEGNNSTPPSTQSPEELKLPRNVDLPLEEIYMALVKGVSLKSNMATQNLSPKAPTTFLYELDQRTQQIVSGIMEKQKSAMPGDQLIVLDGSEANKNCVLHKKQRSLSELTRIRRQFITFTKIHPIDNFNLISTLFVDYLNSNL